MSRGLSFPCTEGPYSAEVGTHPCLENGLKDSLENVGGKRYTGLCQTLVRWDATDTATADPQ